MEQLVVVATSDVHSPRYLMHYMSALARHSGECSAARLVVWAGDMVERGRVSALRPVVEVTRRRCPSARIVAVFGNEEYMDRENEFVRRYPQVVWLNDTYITLETRGLRIAIYGTRGAIDRPTPWQRRHIPGIERVYAERVRRLREEVKRLKSQGYYVIAVMHYAPTRLTIEGEDPSIWPYMASLAMEAAIRDAKPDLVIHGHAHHAKRLEAWINGTYVVNVAFPARGDVTVLRVPMSRAAYAEAGAGDESSTGGEAQPAATESQPPSGGSPQSG